MVFELLKFNRVGVGDWHLVGFDCTIIDNVENELGWVFSIYFHTSIPIHTTSEQQPVVTSNTCIQRGEHII